jgi:NAD(P)-dependent dehydrogenase (short-subunit alcohol dehydrogenase family)
MNNAASFARASTLDSPMLWRQIFDVNLFGALNGIAAFLPGMLAGGGKRLIVNTGSKQGITLPPGNSGYDASKAALNAQTQLLAHDLRSRPGCEVSAHLLVPGWTTNGDNPHKPGAWLPEQVVDYLLAGLEREQFWIVCPDGETTAEMDRRRMLWHAYDPIRGRPALSRWHPDFKDEFDAWMTRELPDL